MPIVDWPEGERPREKLLARGATALSDAELLAIFLRTGGQGKTAVDLGRELLAQFHSLGALLAAPRAQLLAVSGIGEAKYVTLQAVLELSRRQLLESLQRRPVLSSPRATHDYLCARLAGEARELFYCLFLDSQHAVIHGEVLSRGSIDSASIYPREVVKACLSHNAAAVIFAHNHPSGNPQPSEADRQITAQLQAALALLDIRTLDHLIIAGNRAVSMAELGLLPPP